MLTTENDRSIDTTTPSDADKSMATPELAADDNETSPSILDDGVASGQGAEPDGSSRDDRLQQLIEKQHADLTDHLIAWQEAYPDKAQDIESLYRVGNQYKASRILAGDWVFAENDSGNAQGGDAEQADGHIQAAANQQEDGAATESGNVQQQGQVSTSSKDRADEQLTAGTLKKSAGADADSKARLTPEEFGGYAVSIKKIEDLANRAYSARKRLKLSEEDQKILKEIQKRLGRKQTGIFDPDFMHSFHAEFVNIIRPFAEEEEKRHGIPAPVTIGQAILESGYGLRMPGNAKTYNYFGIKPDKKGQPSVKAETGEYEGDGKLVTKTQSFAVHGSMGASVREHSAFLMRNGNYKKLFSTTDPEKWAQGLQDAGYGGRNNKVYARDLIRIMREWHLY